MTAVGAIVGYYIVPVNGSDELWDGTVHQSYLSAEMSLAEADKRDWHPEGEKAKWQIVSLVAEEVA